MKCPNCGNTQDKVIDTRQNNDKTIVRRRRECLSCGEKFSTHEIIDMRLVTVIKKTKDREEFNIEKIKNGVLKACEKRPIPRDKIEDMVDEIRREVCNNLANSSSEVNSKEIGELVMKKLKELDDVAYIRYAAVYQEIGDLETLSGVISEMIAEKKEKKS